MSYNDFEHEPGSSFSRYLPRHFFLLTLAARHRSNNNQPATLASESGFLTLALADGLVDDAAEIVFVFTGIELHRDTESSSGTTSTPRALSICRHFAVTKPPTSWTERKCSWETTRQYAPRHTRKNSPDNSRICQCDVRRRPLYHRSGLETGLNLNRPFVVVRGATA